ncbi:MAG: (d)CMP kinase [Phycisphaerae bacterium]|nr:(d)CMP kinase [Phycisphaerae bacterium]
MIITIDGPAGAGKTTTARKLAARLGVPYLDTGAMYRAITVAALDDGIDLTDEAALTRLAAQDEFNLELGEDGIRVILRGRDITDEIRTMRVNDHTPYIAGSPGVRKLLIGKQRAIAEQLGSLVTEGRDQGSAAFPHADLKFFVTANLPTRAKRRLAELRGDEGATLASVRDNLAERDRTDSERPVAPLVRPPDAIDIDTSALSIDGVVEAMLAHLREAGLVGAESS